MKHLSTFQWGGGILFLAFMAILVSSCGGKPVPMITPATVVPFPTIPTATLPFPTIPTAILPFPTIPTAILTGPYMRMDPPPDSDKPLPVPAYDSSCYLHSASNMLAGAGYGNGTTVQARADDIFAAMSAHFGIFNGGWIDTAIQWWVGSVNNTWTNNPYTVVTVNGGKDCNIPWTDSNGAMEIGNELRSYNLVGLSLTWPADCAGHAITAWGDDSTSSAALTANPGGVRVTDSDDDTGGNVQAYTYDAFTNPNPGRTNKGNGWYINYSTDHPFIKHYTSLSPTNGPSGPNSVRVTGCYLIQQTSETAASDLHYRVGTDVDILSYLTWLDWSGGTSTITEAQPRRELTVDWDLSGNKVPRGTMVTICTEFVEQNWNSISYQDVHFTYPDGMAVKFPDLKWMFKTPLIEKADAIPNVTGGYVIGSFDVTDPNNPNEPAVHYRLVHQYPYNQSPEFHTFTLTGAPGYIVSNLVFGHSYGYPTIAELLRFEKWMTKPGETYNLSQEPVTIQINWKGQLPYPEGDR